jgi:hypothetical protein
MTDPTTRPLAAGGARRVVRTLKDGYWDRTEVVELDDGSRRVRKSTKGGGAPGPWGVAALRKEIAYLASLPERARAAFAPLLAAWDDGAEQVLAAAPRVGYEVPFYAEHTDAGALARRGALPQAEIDRFQDLLAEALFERVHPATLAPAAPAGERLSAHVVDVVAQALAALEADADLERLVRAESIRLNGEPHPGPRAAFARALADGGIAAALDADPEVRLHGDLLLENVLWRRTDGGARDASPRLLLIDPVSVAGVDRGPPLFDLVKYESYATGELAALRSEWLDVAGFDGRGDYAYRIRWQSAELAPFQACDWHTRFRRAFEAKYGSVNRRAYRLLDGYFSVAMAVNTGGVQRRARLLKATSDFNAAIAPGLSSAARQGS